jgi:hypothetical protein
MTDLNQPVLTQSTAQPRPETAGVARVEALAALGCGCREIADYLGLPVACVRSRYGAPWRRGRAYGRVHLRQLLRTQAEDGKASALTCLARQLLGDGAGGRARRRGVTGPIYTENRREHNRRVSAGLRECMADPVTRQALLLVAERMTGLGDAAAPPADPPPAPANPEVGGKA